MTSYLLATLLNTPLTSFSFSSTGTCLKPKWVVLPLLLSSLVGLVGSGGDEEEEEEERARRCACGGVGAAEEGTGRLPVVLLVMHRRRLRPVRLDSVLAMMAVIVLKEEGVWGKPKGVRFGKQACWRKSKGGGSRQMEG